MSFFFHCSLSPTSFKATYMTFFAYEPLCQFARPAIRGTNTTDCSDNRSLFSYNSGIWKSKAKVLAALISNVSLLGLQIATFILCPYIFSLCTSALTLSLSLLVKTSVLVNYSPTCMTSSNFNYLLKGSIFRVRGGRRHNSVHNNLPLSFRVQFL